MLLIVGILITKFNRQYGATTAVFSVPNNLLDDTGLGPSKLMQYTSMFLYTKSRTTAM